MSVYAGQLAVEGRVDKDLLTVEGMSIKSELDILRGAVQRVDEHGDDITFTGKWSDDAELWWALAGNAGLTVLDRNGYTEIGGLSPFEIEDPEAPGQSFVKPLRIEYPYVGITEAVRAIDELRDNPRITHYVGSYAVHRDSQGTPVSVADQIDLTVGSVTRLGEFVPYTTLLNPFHRRTKFIHSVSTRLAPSRPKFHTSGLGNLEAIRNHG